MIYTDRIRQGDGGSRRHSAMNKQIGGMEPLILSNPHHNVRVSHDFGLCDLRKRTVKGS